jgi:FAD/FMN-containing dehydrogenase
VLVAGDEAYDGARSIWNGAIDKKPGVIVRCRDAADVATALQHAREAGIEVSVRGGGHNVAGFALTDGGLTIDLSAMRDVAVDPANRRATCGGGATWEELDGACQQHGLAVPGGFVSHTGVAGLTLGGGLGWLTRRAGLSCDNLIAAEVVTADGRVVRAAELENADLFWAIRGGAATSGW